MWEKLAPLILLFLRLFGVFWIIGGISAFQAARQCFFIDTALEALSQKPEDRLVSYFLFSGSALTFLTGLGLCLGHRWSLIPLTVLILSQLLYFYVRTKQFEQAQTEEARQDYRIQPSTWNAFWVSIVLFGIVLGSERMGLLR